MVQDDFVVTWTGRYFGWIEDGELIAHDGRHVGRFKGEEVFSKNAQYLGELRQHRLITNSAKKGTKTALGFSPQMRTLPPTVSPGAEGAFELPSGYEDFPAPENL